MVSQLLAIAVAGLVPCAPPSDGYRIEGVVVNGSRAGVPVAGAEVVLRAGDGQTFMPAAQVVTDYQGRFAFERVPNEPGLIYLPGANHEGVHYPGPRVRLDSRANIVPVLLTVFDPVAFPSPLVAERFTMDIRPKPGLLEVTETWTIRNPSLATYVGQGAGGRPPVTLTLAVPEKFESVTFEGEFHGRNFQAIDNHLATDLPWPPGERELKYTYRLRAEDVPHVLERTLDLPCTHARVGFQGQHADRVICNLGRAISSDGSSSVFESAGPTLAAGHTLTVQLPTVSVPWLARARWAAIAIFACLILATIGSARARKWLRQRRSPRNRTEQPHQGRRRPRAARRLASRAA